MDYNDIVVEPYITERVRELKKSNKYVFKVNKKTNKSEIKKAIEKIFGVKVKKVNIVNVKPKEGYNNRFKRISWKSSWKKAIVTLEKGKIDIF